MPRMLPSNTVRAPWLLTALVAAFAFRLFYGLSMPFWYEDERQVYLIGLQSFARDEWPYFGADVVWTGSRLPGAPLVPFTPFNRVDRGRAA